MKTTLYGLGVTLTVLPLCAMAQDQTEQSLKEAEEFARDGYLGSIVLSAPLLPTGEDGISVTSEGIALSNPADLSELFVAEPTIAVGSSIPMSQKVYVNGIEENNLAISIDGARQNNKIFHHNTTTLIDPALLKAVRIDPGVAPADAGPGALAGGLAYETKDVVDLLEPGRTVGARYKFEFDTNGPVFANSVTLFGRQSMGAGAFEYLGFLKYASGGRREDANGIPIIGSGTDVLSGLGKLAYEAQSGDRIEFSFEQVHDDAIRPFRANIGVINAGRPVPPIRSYDLERTNVTLTYTDSKPTGLWDPTLRIAYSGTKLVNDESGLPPIFPTFPIADFFYTSGETTSVSAEASNRFSLSWGEINAGVDFYSDEASLAAVSIATLAAGGVREKLQNTGIFAQVRTEPSRYWRLSAGARYDFQDFTGINGFQQSEDGFSGNAVGEFFVTDQITLSAGYSHVWGGVELAENYIMNPTWVYPATGIEEVTADNAFIAAAYAAGTWAVDGKVFYTEINDARAASFTVGPAVVADVQSEGFEIGISKTWSQGFVRVGFARVETDVNDLPADSFTGNYLTIPLGDFLTVQAAHEFNNGLLVGGDAQVAFDFDGTAPFGLAGVPPRIDGYTVVNVFAEFSPNSTDNLVLRVEVNNLFDEQYASRATYGQDFPGSVVPLFEPGRSLRLSGEVTF